jgi:hypothetical protein
MTRRLRVPAKTEQFVLTKSRRRCCLCFHLHGDHSVKQGQIAHIDQDPSNNRADNLVFLCFEHHNEYDTKPAQGKGLQPQEVGFARAQLYAALDTSLGIELSELDWHTDGSGPPESAEDFPRFHNEYEVSYARFIRNTDDLLYVGTTGFTFLMRHEIPLLNCGARGARIRMVLAEPSEFNLRTIASWSAFRPADTYERIKSREIPEVMERLRTLEAVAGKRLEVRLLEYLAPVHMVQFDAGTERGAIVLKLYPIGISASRELFRPATVITANLHPMLFEHLRINGENAWERARQYRVR